MSSLNSNIDIFAAEWTEKIQQNNFVIFNAILKA